MTTREFKKFGAIASKPRGKFIMKFLRDLGSIANQKVLLTFLKLFTHGNECNVASFYSLKEDRTCHM